MALQAAGTKRVTPAGLILLGTKVNLSRNRQAKTFTGISDASLGWVQALTAANPPTDVLLISGSWDDILPPAAADLLLGGIFFFFPMPLPALNLYYVCFIGGYGLLLLFLYGRGWMPGTAGRLPFVTWETVVAPGRILLAAGVVAAMLIFTTLFSGTGLFGVPAGTRLLWVLIYTPLTALGLGIGLRELQIVQQAAPGRPGALLATALIGFIPFILYTIFLAALGSISGMLGGLQGLLILALVFLTVGLVHQVGQRLWLTAVSQALLLYRLVLPVGPLFYQRILL